MYEEQTQKNPFCTAKWIKVAFTVVVEGYPQIGRFHDKPWQPCRHHHSPALLLYMSAIRCSYISARYICDSSSNDHEDRWNIWRSICKSMLHCLALERMTGKCHKISWNLRLDFKISPLHRQKPLSAPPCLPTVRRIRLTRSVACCSKVMMLPAFTTTSDFTTDRPHFVQTAQWKTINCLAIELCRVYRAAGWCITIP